MAKELTEREDCTGKDERKDWAYMVKGKKTMKVVKKDISLYVAYAYLNGLYCNARNLFCDEKCANAYNALKKRVYEMVDTDIESDITDMYVIVEEENNENDEDYAEDGLAANMEQMEIEV